MTNVTTIATLNSQLNALLEKHADIVRNAQMFAESLLDEKLVSLKQIAEDWNATPENRRQKASYITAIWNAHAERNGLSEVNEQIEKLTFQIKCAEAQECANATQKMVRVIRTIEQTWWVGTEETFNAIYPNEGYEIHFTAHPEKPANECDICHNQTDNYMIKGRKILCAPCVKEMNGPLPITRPVETSLQGVEQEPPQELVAWLDEIREVGIAPSSSGNAPKSYTITGYRTDGTNKQWRCMDAYQAERDAQTLWETGRWARLEINGEVRYPVQEPATPLQGVASFFHSLAVFSSHDILPLDIVGDVTLYEQLKSQWDAMNGDELCQCDWCDPSPLQQQEQEELQFMEKQKPQQVQSISLGEQGEIIIYDNGGVEISDKYDTVHFSPHEAYTVLEALYQQRDLLYKNAQEEGSDEPQEQHSTDTEKQTYAKKHLWEHLTESEKATMQEQRIRKPDYDLEAYLEHNTDIFTLDDIANIHAEVPGHNDEDSWYWIIELKDGRFILTNAWCDYTGWDCQSGGNSQVASTALEAAQLAPEQDYGRNIRENLIAQLEGKLAFGLEIRNP